MMVFLCIRQGHLHLSTCAREYILYFILRPPAIAGGLWHAGDKGEGHSVIFIMHFVLFSREVLLVRPTADFLFRFVCIYQHQAYNCTYVQRF